jgi:endonuclease/exonuclease/phosphatase family metal-dependent hydrolase
MPETLTVMSFNIRGAFVTSDGANIWENRAALNVKTIQRHAPDLIGFQELQTGNLDVYHQELPEYVFLRGPQYNNQEPFCYPTIAWKQARFSLVDSGEFWLSPTPEVFSGGWDTDCWRSALWVKLRCADTGGELVHLNTHLDHISELARVEGARLIVERTAAARQGSVPMLVTGDFNCNPGSAAHTAFLDDGFADTWQTVGNTDGDDTFTYHAFTGMRPEKARRIDWILLHDPAQSLEVVSSKIIHDQEPPLYPSDHFPVVAEFQRKGGSC